MKIRQGFVSNSSSSSFLIAIKTNKPITEFKIQNSHLLESNITGFKEEIEYIITNIIHENRSEPMTVEDYLKYELYYDSIFEYFEVKTKKDLEKINHIYAKWYLAGYKICWGEFESSGRQLERIMAKTPITIETEDFIFENEGSY